MQKLTIGRELRPSEITVTLDGNDINGKFDLMAASVAEDVYEEKYGKYADILGIARQLSRGSTAAALVILYAALVRGGLEMEFDAFASRFDLKQLQAVRGEALRMVMHFLPREDKDAKKE